jgi:hypothetical protein
MLSLDLSSADFIIDTCGSLRDDGLIFRMNNPNAWSITTVGDITASKLKAERFGKYSQSPYRLSGSVVRVE